MGRLLLPIHAWSLPTTCLSRWVAWVCWRPVTPASDCHDLSCRRLSQRHSTSHPRTEDADWTFLRLSCAIVACGLAWAVWRGWLPARSSLCFLASACCRPAGRTYVGWPHHPPDHSWIVGYTAAGVAPRHRTASLCSLRAASWLSLRQYLSRSAVRMIRCWFASMTNHSLILLLLIPLNLSLKHSLLLFLLHYFLWPAFSLILLSLIPLWQVVLFQHGQQVPSWLLLWLQHPIEQLSRRPSLPLCQSSWI